MERYIKVGMSSKDGDIYEEYEKAKSCQFCIHFKGYGLHGVAGKCTKLNKELFGGYSGGYRKAALECGEFDCQPDRLKEENN